MLDSKKLQSALFSCFLVLTPLLFNPLDGSVERVKFIVLCIFSLIFYLLKRTDKINEIFKWTIVLLIFFGFISTILSQDIYLAFWGSPERCFGFAAFLSAMMLALGIPKIDYKSLINFFIVSGTLSTLAAIILGIFSQDSLFEGRISGTLGNPNLLGQFLAVTLFFGIYRFIEKRNKIDLIHVLIQAFGLLLSGNRASIFALILVTIIYVIHTKKSWKVISLFAILPIISLFFISDRIFAGQSILTRIEIYSSAIKAIIKTPFFGSGFEHVQNVLMLPSSYTMIADRVHQLFLDFAVMAGIPFTITLIVLSVFTLIVLFKKQPVFGFAFLALLLSLQVGFMGIVNLIQFSIFVGLAIGLSHTRFSR